jgi:ribosomal protein S18 acetylase RimI-like enzyme
MQVVSLNSALEARFWRHVTQDSLDYYFYIFDWEHKQDQTQIQLALGSNNEILGLLLIYNGSIWQVRGTREAVQLLLGALNGAGELSAPLDCRDVVLERFPNPKLAEEMNLLALRRGEETLQITTAPQQLGVGDAEAVARLMREAYPSHWGEVTADSLAGRFGETVWLGIRDGGRLAALGVAASALMGSHIMFIATDKAYRRRGYATSIVSAFTQQILQRSEVATIHVINSNAPAKHTYEKVGFKPYKQYLYLKI